IPDDIAREAIFRIHTRSLNIEERVDFRRLVNLTEGATGADIKAISTEAGMFAIRKDAYIITNGDFIDAIDKVMKKVKDKCIESRLYS
ncbi:MAG: proteasome-activating nucleotidase, partial [Promethearchaeota archaeon]